DRHRIARPTLKDRFGENDFFGNTAVAIGVVHVGVRVDADVAAAINTARFEENVLGLTAIGAAIHPQRSADRTRNSPHEGETGDPRFLSRARDAHIGNRSTNAKPIASLDLDVAKPTAQANHHPGDTAVANDDVRSKADRRYRKVFGNMAEKI